MRLGLLVLLLVLAGCGGDEYAELDPKNPSRAAEGLVFTRADGSSYEVNDAVARCIEHRELPGVEVVRLVAPAGRLRPLMAARGGSRLWSSTWRSASRAR